MDANRPIFRITIKELVLEIEDENAVQNLGRSLGGLLIQPATWGEPQTLPLATSELSPRRRGRRPKAVVAEAPEQGRRRRRPRAESATAQIRRMRDEGYFVQARRANEVKTQLRALGHELENRQVYATLKYMADKGILNRDQDAADGTWLYSASPA